MTRFSKGTRVVAVENIGGFAREYVPKGSKGVVTDAPLMSEAEVTFEIKSFWGDKKATIRVADSEIF